MFIHQCHLLIRLCLCATAVAMFGFGDHIRCLICLECGHSSHACPRASGKRLGFRSLSPTHLEACRRGLDLEANEDGERLTAAQHVGGGNVKVESRYFSCCRHDVDPALRWTTLTVDKDTRRTRPLKPEDFSTKAVAVLDLDMVSIKYDVSTPSLTIAHGVEPHWRAVLLHILLLLLLLLLLLAKIQCRLPRPLN